MPASIIDSAHLPGHLHDRRMRQVWSRREPHRQVPRHRSARWPSCRAAGHHPEGGGRRDRQQLPSSTQIDMGRLRQQTERIGYPILGVVTQLNELCRDKLGEYCTGARPRRTSPTPRPCCRSARRWRWSTANWPAIADGAGRAGQAASPDADDRAQQPAAGDPVTFGYKMAGLLSAILRHRERLAQLRQRVLVGEFAGAAGTLASLEKGAMETQAGLMRRTRPRRSR